MRKARPGQKGEGDEHPADSARQRRVPGAERKLTSLMAQDHSPQEDRARVSPKRAESSLALKIRSTTAAPLTTRSGVGRTPRSPVYNTRKPDYVRRISWPKTRPQADR